MNEAERKMSVDVNVVFLGPFKKGLTQKVPHQKKGSSQRENEKFFKAITFAEFNIALSEGWTKIVERI